MRRKFVLLFFFMAFLILPCRSSHAFILDLISGLGYAVLDGTDADSSGLTINNAGTAGYFFSYRLWELMYSWPKEVIVSHLDFCIESFALFLPNSVSINYYHKLGSSYNHFVLGLGGIINFYKIFSYFPKGEIGTKDWPDTLIKEIDPVSFSYFLRAGVLLDSIYTQFYGGLLYNPVRNTLSPMAGAMIELYWY